MFTDILICVLGTFGFAILLKACRERLVIITIGGAISATISIILLELKFSTFFATFIAMLAICVYSEVIARLAKMPANVLLLPSTIPLLPGGSLYYAMSYATNGNKELFYHYAKETAQSGFGIAFGAICVSIFITYISKKNTS